MGVVHRVPMAQPLRAPASWVPRVLADSPGKTDAMGFQVAPRLSARHAVEQLGYVGGRLPLSCCGWLLEVVDLHSGDFRSSKPCGK